MLITAFFKPCARCVRRSGKRAIEKLAVLTNSANFSFNTSPPRCGSIHRGRRINCDYRKRYGLLTEWIRDRLHLLGECFAVAIHAYAVMGNHLPLVLQLDTATTAGWSDEAVASRWVRLFPPRENTDPAWELKRQHLLPTPDRLATVRARLGNLSWFMRCLAEPIARRANRDDGCTGRFWEGRFRCQLLCDERALLAAMAYVDLNPIRAGITDRLETSSHTSVHERIKTARSGQVLAAPLQPLIGVSASGLSLSTADYLHILDWTGRAVARGKRGRIAARAPVILWVSRNFSAPEQVFTGSVQVNLT